MQKRQTLARNLLALLLLPALLGPAHLNAQEPADSLSLLQVNGSVYMLSGAGVNVAVQVGEEGLLFVDSPSQEVVPRMMELIREKSDLPVRYVINTHLDADHVASNDLLLNMGDRAQAMFGRGAAVAAAGATTGVNIIGHENVLNRFYLTEHDIPALTMTTTFYTPSKDFYVNGEGVMIYHMPKAHTDGDSIVHFRGSDVIAMGDLFTPGQYPVIDLEKGGSVDGFIDALNFVLHLMVPGQMAEGGTYVIPGHGRIGDEIDVVEYRNMLVIVKERIEEYMRREMSLRDIMAMQPTLDYDTEYGGHRGGPTSEQFITAIYNSLRNTRGS